jgi:glucosamine--fructose-6-phosphate aminotransferase (isomerizing)
MCGIIGRVGPDGSVDQLLEGLENLEYRGYDSAGIAVKNGRGIEVEKRSGHVDDLESVVESGTAEGTVGIGHTRWSTHGPPTDANAHPHTSETDSVAVVHNGVINNYDELRDELARAGVEFTSQTDTEVIPHLFERYLDEHGDPERAFRATIERLEGSYAIAALVDGTDALYVTRDGSPLVIGLAGDAHYVASDVPAFLEFTDEVIFLEDGDVGVLEADRVRITGPDGERREREAETVDWNADETGKGPYDHYMLKEIHSQPAALTKTIEGRVGESGVSLEGFAEDAFEGVTDVQLVGCGTSYHAALFGARLFRRAGLRAEAIRANEYDTAASPAVEGTLTVAVTQSGETADTLGALRDAADRGARTLTVTNVVGSSATRIADDSVFIRAGPEIGVAATKTFSSQAVTLGLLVHRIAADVGGAGFEEGEAFLEGLAALPEHLRTVLDSTAAASVAHDYSASDAYFFIGRGLANPVAKEGALKFKEITYEHAEGFASGELKHGPLALVTPQTPIFALATGDDEQDDKTYKNAKEAQARGAPVIAVGPSSSKLADIADAHLEVPETDPVWSGLLGNVQLQLLAYHAASLLDRSIDKPRNLAKSVTVE